MLLFSKTFQIYQQSYLKWDLDGTAAGVVNAMTIKLVS